MKLSTSIFLTILLWISLPIVLIIYFSAATPASLAKPVILFILYTGFSWSIALLAFVMESARQQLFNNPMPARSALRLGSYGSFAVILAMLTSPWPGVAAMNESLTVIGLVFAYCYLMGYLYSRYIHPDTPLSGDSADPS